MNKVICDICGKEVDEIDAKPTFTGRSVLYQCRDCVKSGKDAIAGRKADYFWHTSEGKTRRKKGK